MASSGINFEGLTPSNGALRELAELIFLEQFGEDKLGQVITFLTGQEQGKKLGFVNPLGLVGRASDGCNPTYDSNAVTTSEKEWAFKEWQIAEQICYEELEGTLAESYPRNGSDVADLTDSEYMETVVRPLFENAIPKLMFRLIFFGDTEIAGQLKDGVDAKYFNLFDGIWKQLFTGVTEGKTKRFTIDANTKTTIDAQYEAMLAPGAATGVIDEIILRTPAKVLNQANRAFFVTDAFAKCLGLDIQRNNKGSELQWKSLFEGVRATEYQGYTVIAIAQWDEIIQDYLKNTTNANAYDKPFRVIFGSKGNFRAGTKSKDAVATLKAFFVEKEQMNYLLAKDTLDAKVAAEEYAVVAY